MRDLPPTAASSRSASQSSWRVTSPRAGLPNATASAPLSVWRQNCSPAPARRRTLAFRVPKELFHPRQRFHLEVLARDREGLQRVLWAKRYEASWVGSVPHVEVVADLLGEEPDGVRPPA